MSQDLTKLAQAFNTYLNLNEQTATVDILPTSTMTRVEWCTYMQTLLKNVFLPDSTLQMITRARALNIQYNDLVRLDSLDTIDAKVDHLFSLGDNAIKMFMMNTHQEENSLHYSGMLGNVRHPRRPSPPASPVIRSRPVRQVLRHEDDPYEGIRYEAQYTIADDDNFYDVMTNSYIDGRGRLFRMIFAGVVLALVMFTIMNTTSSLFDIPGSRADFQEERQWYRTDEEEREYRRVNEIWGRTYEQRKNREEKERWGRTDEDERQYNAQDERWGRTDEEERQHRAQDERWGRTYEQRQSRAQQERWDRAYEEEQEEKNKAKKDRERKKQEEQNATKEREKKQKPTQSKNCRATKVDRSKIGEKCRDDQGRREVMRYIHPDINSACKEYANDLSVECNVIYQP